MTQAQVAAELELPSVTSNYVSRWERGEHEPNEDYIAALAAVLETTVADLMAGPTAARSGEAETPDLLGQMNGKSQLDRMEEKLDELLRRREEDHPRGEGAIPTEVPPDPASQPEPRGGGAARRAAS